jgi:hypothetical protein
VAATSTRTGANDKMTGKVHLGACVAGRVLKASQVGSIELFGITEFRGF